MALNKYIMCGFQISPHLIQNVYKYARALKYSDVKNPTIDVGDPLDNFTTDLLQKKMAVWESKKANLQKSEEINIIKNKFDCSNLLNKNEVELREIIINAIKDYNDNYVLEVIAYCLNNNICLDQHIYLHVLNICAQKGQVELINQIDKMLREKNITLGSLFNISIFMAKAVWIKGNITKAISIFEELYEKEPYTRRQIKLVLRYLVKDGITNRSESILVNFIKFSQKLIDNYNDYYLMVNVWEICFISEWFSDQQIAYDLCKKDTKLCNKLVSRLAYIVTLSIKNEKTDVLYRLLEVLLSFKMIEQYPLVLIALLDYHFKRGDLKNYMEVLKWSLVNDVTLPKIYSKRYLELMCLENNKFKHKKVVNGQTRHEKLYKNFKF